MNNPTSASRTRIKRLAPFVLALLCFVLPFVEVSCQGQKAGTATGLELATGQSNQMAEQAQRQPAQKFGIANYIFLSALVGIGLAAVLGLFPGIAGELFSFCAGLVAIAFLVAGRTRVEAELRQQGGEILSCHWLPGYWATLLFLVIGTVLSLRFLAEEWKRVPEYRPPAQK